MAEDARRLGHTTCRWCWPEDSMTDKKRKDKSAQPSSDDIMHGRSFEGTSYAATEREQTEDARRIPGRTDEAGEFVTDAEMEVREANSSPQNDERGDKQDDT